MRALVAGHAGLIFRLSLFPVLAVAIAMRLPMAFTQGRLWAEEGTVYFARAWNLPALEALRALHSGYLNIVANVATLVASTAVPLERAPLVTAGIALLVQLMPALLLMTATEAWLRRPAALLAAVALTVLQVRAGEVWLNSINSHFHLMACGGLILALAPRGGAVGVLRLGLLLLGALSGPGNAFLWPFFVWRAWRERNRARWVQAAVMAMGIAVQAALVLSAPIEPRPFGVPASVVLSFMGIQHVLLPLLGGQTTFSIAAGVYFAHGAGQVPIWPLLVPVPFLVLGGWASWRADAATRWLFIGGVWLAVLSYYSSLALPSRHVLLLGIGCRYTVAPTLLFGTCLIGVAMTGRELLLRQAATGLVWWALAVGTLGYRDIPSFTAGPPWAQEVAAWRADPHHVIQIWPPGWTMLLVPVPR